MQHASALFRLLGDSTRLRLLRVLAEDRFNVSELTGILGAAQSGVSRHLGLLKDAGLVVDRAEGTRRIYGIDPAGLGAIRTWLDRFWTVALADFQAEIDKDGEQK